MVIPASLGYAGGDQPDSKLDPTLMLLKQQEISVATAQSMNIIKESPGQESRVKTLIRFEGDIGGIKALGGDIGSVLGDIATVDVPLGSLSALSQMENVSYVEVSKKLRPSLNISVPETRADDLRSGTPPTWTGDTGQDVIIGFVDTGIDLSHPDFRDSTGKTRILFLWDQTTNQECTNLTIDNGTCSEIDTEGHGTHVAGIAAGNGTASGDEYVGMAPESDLIVVKTTFYTQDILNGISYIEQKAASLGKPCVINLSLGGDVDPHDGTSNYSRALDNATGPGRIIVGAAGNEAVDGNHASGYAVQGAQVPVSFEVLPESAIAIDIWYPGSDLMDIRISTPDCGSTGWVSPSGVNTFSTSCGKISVVSEKNNPNNGDKEIYIVLTNPRLGQWGFSLSGDSISSGRFDAWTTSGAVFPSSDSSITLSDTGSTTNVISVGSYVTRPLNGAEPSAGDISIFSSHGPRRLCSICSEVQKPDIAAPGQWIMSAFSEDTSDPSFFLLDPSGGPYILMQGTSMSSPHVAGAVALMLHKNSTLSPEDIKNNLSLTAVTDSHTGNTPNFVWGYGKLDAYTAVSALAAEAVSAPTIAGPPSGYAGVQYAFSAGGASSSFGHGIQYLFDWGDGSGSGWLPAGSTSAAHAWDMPGTYQVRAQARSASDTTVVSDWSPELTVAVSPAISLQSPADGISFDACSLYALPAFAWDAGVSFKGLRIEFSPNDSFSVIPARVQVSPGNTGTTLKLKPWKKVLRTPGESGGTGYWRVVGLRPNNTTAVSDVRSFIVEPARAVGEPGISNTARSPLPVLSWANNCNTKFKVWFAGDPDFTKSGVERKKLVFTIGNPGDNGGVFSRQLTKRQWASIRKLAGDLIGSHIYWYVESRDGLRRRFQTDVMSFTLSD